MFTHSIYVTSPSYSFYGKRLTGKRLSGKVLIRETSVNPSNWLHGESACNNWSANNTVKQSTDDIRSVFVTMLTTVQLCCWNLDLLSETQYELLNPVYTIQPVLKPVVQPAWQPALSCKQISNRLSKRLSNQFDNWVNVCIHDTVGCQTGCQTSLTTGWLFVYTVQPVVKTVWQRVWQPVVSCKRGFTNQQQMRTQAGYTY